MYHLTATASVYTEKNCVSQYNDLDNLKSAIKPNYRLRRIVQIKKFNSTLLYSTLLYSTLPVAPLHIPVVVRQR
jgi:hypothetical protein